MRCKKCTYITFDFYNECPKCGTSFKEIKEKLNIIDYSISDECNYLIPEEIEQEELKTRERMEPELEQKAILIRQGKEEDIKIEHTKIEEEEKNIDIPDKVEEDEDGLSISELLETTKLEE